MMHDMRPLITVAIFSGEVESRISYLIKSINSINMQTYSNLQKILVKCNRSRSSGCTKNVTQKNLK